MPRPSEIFARCRGSAKSWPPTSEVVFENKREPIALHWPVMEFGPVPGLPILPVIRQRLMIAWAVRTPSWDWFTPMVHHQETRLPGSETVRASDSICSTDRPVFSATEAGG